MPQIPGSTEQSDFQCWQVIGPREDVICYIINHAVHVEQLAVKSVIGPREDV